MRKTIAAIALDMDGTLLRSDGTVSPRTLEVLYRCREQGMRVVIATGRRPSSAIAALPEEIGAAAWVCYNGAEIHLDGACIHTDYIVPQDALAIVEWTQSYWPDCILSAEVDGRLFLNREIGLPLNYEVADLAAVVSRPAAKLVLSLAGLEDADAVHANLPPACKMLVTGGGKWGEIMAVSASKATGLALALARWGLSLEDAIAFGDDNNDREMVVESGIGVAMGNAVPELKEVADVVAPTNDEDGVAVVLEENVIREA